MTAEQTPAPEQRWRARPVLAGTLRAVLLAVPLVASTAATYLLAQLLPDGTARTWWGLSALLITAVVVAIAVERGARRLLPIALLLKLSMIFPDRAPSRLKLARTAAVRAPTNELVWNGSATEPTSTADLVLNLVAALGSHDRRTRGHSERVRLLCDMLAEELKLDDDARDRLRWSALLHDVGKMHVSTSILNKPGRLDAREFDRIKQHPALGAELAAPLLPWLGEWGDGILDHHEKYDGSGYPNGKAGADISQAGRLIGLIDAFETMTAARAYKKAMATKAAREELARCSGTHFDPVFVRAFLAISLPRVLWAMGPASFLFQLPFIRPLAEAGVRTSAVAPQSAAVAMASGAAGAAVLVTGGMAVGGPTLALAEAGDGGRPAAAPQSAPQWLHDQLGTVPSPLVEREPAPVVTQEQPEADPIVAAPHGSSGSVPLRPDHRTPPAPAELTPADHAPTGAAPVQEDPAEEPAAGELPEPEPEPEPADEDEWESQLPSEPDPVVEEPPAEEPPAEEPPAEEPPAEEPPVEEPPAEEPPAEEPPAEEPPAEEPPAEEPPAEEPPAEQPPAAEPPADDLDDNSGQISAGILSGPDDSASTTATFQLAPGKNWECQVSGNGDTKTSQFKVCADTTTGVYTYVVTDLTASTHTLKVRNADQKSETYSWTWTVDPTLVSGRAATGLMLLDEVAADVSEELASPSRSGPGLPLMALVMSLGLPIAAFARRLRARRF